MDVFISYRRAGGLELARNIWTELKNMEYYSFFDLDSIREGEFPQAIRRNILRSDNFLILLTPGALDRCSNENDWVRHELKIAFEYGKNIIPVVCNDFKFPKDLPEDIRRIGMIQAVIYNGINFSDMISSIIERLKDENGYPLRVIKKRNTSNTFYEEHMSEEEKDRIKADYLSCKKVEDEIFERLLKGKRNVVLFNPAIYEIDSYMSKYDREEIGYVYGLLNHKDEVEDAMARYAVRGTQKNAFYVGNMEHDNFEDEMDKILSENKVRSFDFVDLTLILRDLAEPEDKLIQVADRVSSGGVIYVRELDHNMAIAYPDDRGLFKKMFYLIKRDIYSGDFNAGRKVYFWMKNADLRNIHFEGKQISTVGLRRRERRTLFQALFSYVEREYRVIHEKEPTTETRRALEWLEENYKTMETQFSSDDFFFSTGFMEFHGFVE